MRYEHDKWSNWWCHVARMNCYASVFIVILRIFSSNFSLAWVPNSSAISWHQPIIAYCCKFADDAHPCWSWWQPGWQPWWLATPTTAVCSGVLYPVPGEPKDNGGSFAPHRAKHCSWPPTSTRGRAKSAQYIQGVSGYKASNLLGGWGTTAGWWVAKYH